MFGCNFMKNKNLVKKHVITEFLYQELYDTCTVRKKRDLACIYMYIYTHDTYTVKLFC